MLILLITLCQLQKNKTTIMKNIFNAVILISFICITNITYPGNIPKSINAKTYNQIKIILNTISPDSLKSYDHTLVSFGTRQTMSDTVSSTRGIGAARRWIISKFNSFSAVDPDFKVYEDEFTLNNVPRINIPTKLVNVYGILWGKEGENGRYIIISGHMDSRCTDIMNYTSDAPGADDDGSGVSLSIEAARVFTANHFKPNANIIFMCFDGEEQGLYGSEHFASDARKKNMSIIADLNNDIVGAVRGGNGILNNNTIRLFSEYYDSLEIGNREISAGRIGYENDSPSRELARYIKSNSKEFLPSFNIELIYRQDRFLRGGDHYSFNKYGYAGVRFTEPNEDYHHQHQDVRTENEFVNGKEMKVLYGDLPQFMDYKFLSKVCRINTLNAALLSISPEAPQHLEMLVDKLEYGTRFKWENADMGKNISGWKIYYRKTYEPYWSGFVPVEGSANSTIEYNLKSLSKDNYIFGISTVGTNGIESIPIAPLPGR